MAPGSTERHAGIETGLDFGMTSLAEERAEQRRWKALQTSKMPAYDRLLENEFVPEERHRARMAAALGRTLRLAAQNVPFYRSNSSLLAAHLADAEPFQILASLPLLTKFDVQENEAALCAEQLPEGDSISKWMSSSGTTGRPTRVLHSRLSTGMYIFLKQREYRWCRFNPVGKFALIRLSTRGLKEREAKQMSTWTSVRHFKTGPSLGFNVINPPEVQLAWLRRERPDYLATYPETLEHLAFIAGEERPVDSLKGILAVSETLMPNMRAHIERSYGVPVHQNYGLNEIGLVASRCEAGRYHVHTEHCLVEILGDNGAPCKPGETGRIVVTALSNPAMPLLRYDTGDVAEAVGGSCPCGRVLPAFGDVMGRYSRIAHLPEGTLGLVAALRTCIEEMPRALIRGLKEFQIHQFKDDSFEIRLAAGSPLDAAFEERLRAAWSDAAPGRPLSFVYVDDIAFAHGGKKQVFTSDFMPEPGSN